MLVAVARGEEWEQGWSQFTGTKGLIWGYDLAIDKRFLEGRLDKVTGIKQDDLEVPVYDVTPLLNFTHQLLGANNQRHFIPMKGSHIVCTTKSCTMTPEQAKSDGWVWCALSLSIATNRIIMSSLFMEDNGYLDSRLTEKNVRNILSKRVVTIAEVAVACGNDQHTTYKEIFVGWKATRVPVDAVGCSPVCAPYFCIPQEANPSNKNSDLLEWSTDDGLVKCQLETFARKMISLLGKAKTHGMREFMLINDRLSTILTQYAGEMAFVQRSQLDIANPPVQDYETISALTPALS